MKMNIQLSNIHHNPYRDMDLNPVLTAQVEAIKDSIERSTFWENVVIRHHPEIKGDYQLAHGHNRLAALKDLGITEANFVIKELTDAQMVNSMIDENETQRGMTPVLIHENIGAAMMLLEPFMDKGLLYSDFKDLVPTGTTYRKLNQEDVSEKAYDMAIASFNKGEGFSWKFLSYFVHGKQSSRHDNVQAYVESREDWQTAKVKRLRKEADDATASAEKKRNKADIAPDEKTRKKREEEAEKKDADASNKLNKAASIEAGQVDASIQFGFETANQATDFIACMKRWQIKKADHKKYADAVIDGNEFGKKMSPFVWQMYIKGRKSSDAKQWKSQYDSEFDTFAEALLLTLVSTDKKVRALTEYESQLEDIDKRTSYVVRANALIKSLNSLCVALNSEGVIDV